jgi:hypothetical protein
MKSEIRRQHCIVSSDEQELKVEMTNLGSASSYELRANASGRFQYSLAVETLGLQ